MATVHAAKRRPRARTELGRSGGDRYDWYRPSRVRMAAPCCDSRDADLDDVGTLLFEL